MLWQYRAVWKQSQPRDQKARMGLDTVTSLPCDHSPPFSSSGKCWAGMRLSLGPLQSLTVCDFQVTVMFAVAMGGHVWNDCVFCSFNGDWGSFCIWHQLSGVSTMKLTGWASKADPRDRLILTGKQLKGEIGALWGKTSAGPGCLWSSLYWNMWFNWYGQMCPGWGPFLKRAGDCGPERTHRHFQIYFHFSRLPIAKMTISWYLLLLMMPSNLLEN